MVLVHLLEPGYTRAQATLPLSRAGLGGESCIEGVQRCTYMAEVIDEVKTTRLASPALATEFSTFRVPSASAQRGVTT